jgi:hypothetical protein
LAALKLPAVIAVQSRGRSAGGARELVEGGVDVADRAGEVGHGHVQRADLRAQLGEHAVGETGGAGRRQVDGAVTGDCVQQRTADRRNREAGSLGAGGNGVGATAVDQFLLRSG